MTYLDTDKQTKADLSIDEVQYDGYPLFSLYGGTKTPKGKRLMQAWISSPLNNRTDIRKRQEAIAWQELPEIPLAEEELDFIEYYLEYRDQISRPYWLLSLATTFDRIFRRDPKRYIIKRGVHLIIRLLHQLEILRKGTPQNAPLLLQEMAQHIHDSIYASELKEVVLQTSDEKQLLSNYIVDKYDYLFRCVRLETIRALLAELYVLDVCHTAHRVAKNKDFCCTPEMVETMNFSISDFTHPFIKDAKSNDWKMSGSNICILTGSNMAGKSTTLKAITLAVWLAHCGLPVPARSMTCPVFDGIYTSINLPDSLRDGRSHFLAEILRIKEVLQKAATGKRCLIILDEMFRGTNADDAFESSVAVNNLLKKYRNCSFLISTHILEYAKTFEKDATCCFYYMDSRIEQENFICSYQLLEGISETKVGHWLVKTKLKDLI
ncbi:MutS-related protein [Bacteroides reticulotermitis]|uniref:MutS-related protein n=2 Tax=Bacteroides reticulotermitis TaxID=1133319 RepID=W4UP91_9BACE|nr:DNA mismatch repair protein MutS [Bacteroides reticulotermitis]MBB4044925.1 DNA mismatch repair ATPase MutS [Bacteroides reticulotermitis]GAE82771.1 MutS-related protein [Bacteroides reticulotermitis JCM 10512]